MVTNRQTHTHTHKLSTVPSTHAGEGNKGDARTNCQVCTVCDRGKREETSARGILGRDLRGGGPHPDTSSVSC